MNVTEDMRLGRQTGASAALIVAMVALATEMFVYGLAIPVLPAIAVSEGAPAVAIGLLFACYAAAGTAWTASLALVAATHEPATRGRAMGTALSAIGVGTLAGPPAGRSCS